MKVVLDSNVILAALLTRGLCESVVTICLESHQTLLSEHILSEVGGHLEGKFKMSRAQAQEKIEVFRRHCEIVQPGRVSGDACRDPDDLAVLGTALAGGAECLITGDKDLLAIGEFKDVAILSPRAFHEHVKGRHGRQ
jgi:putative PIN family toxin of toxin-antitoxin system